ncbi:MAG TPA: lysylphosphatidylglycerol synthase transmembrane domain-containing protein [Gemmatimonadaceae bacterium]|nr:lysylphosphatidylglycerol synthase transmembrane domain-containing protein [Gemmatimonadaceae bacterium]
MRFGWRGVLGILLSIALLWYAFHDIEWAKVAVAIRHANLWLLLLSAIAATGIFPLRARRWRTILDPVALHLPMGPLWRATAIGMMVNNVAPARAGEPARAYVLSREVEQVPFSTAFASLAVDRVFDSLIVFSLMFGAMLLPSFPKGAAAPVARYAIWGVVFVSVVIVALYLIVYFPTQIISLFELFARRVAPSFEARGRDILVSFANGLSVLRSPRRFIAVFLWALLHWLLNAFAFWLGFLAVGIHVPLAAAFFVQGIIVLSVAIPSSPGFFGFFEAAGKFALGMYGVSETMAVTWAVGFHVLSFIPITILGGYYFARAGLTLTELTKAGSDGSESETGPTPHDSATRSPLEPPAA